MVGRPGCCLYSGLRIVRGLDRAGWRGTGPVGPIVGVAFGISGIATLVTGLISTIKSKERSILVFLAVVVGLFVLIFLLGEFLYPH